MSHGSPISRARGADRRFYGVVEAIVVKNGDKDDREGRVKIKFPWFDDQMVTEWCRVPQPYAGNGYGAFFVPEEGDEVLVAFIHGEMRYPVIIGGLYNGKDKPPSWRDGTAKDEKMIRTKGKHEILLDDSRGKERIRFTTGDSHVVTLDDASQHVSIRTKKGHTLLLDDKGAKVDLHTARGAKVTLEDQSGTITIHVGSQTMTLDSSGVTIQASKVSVTAQSVVLGGAGAQSLVLGPALLAAFNTHTHNCTAPGTPSGPPLPPLSNAVFTKVTTAS